MFLLRAVLNVLVRNTSLRGHMCFRRLIFIYHDLVNCYFCFVLLPLDMRSGECNVLSLYVMCCPVNGSVCFVCCGFVNCLVKQFAICFGVFVILLLSVVGCALLVYGLP